ncbi:hypothetical protein SCLCIDRAFT_1218356 [Scleroderma citrinum Foug A]|uniref:Uncharacterized protein n=1 Tax=Scleroderma citrinum Foug A TaxID=1036808 RepID=A0A0C3DRH8_9AGAM|nr:hypothetical protein SCLCIDRAFT_1218356 [Scleroderma citrinum Foug A]
MSNYSKSGSSYRYNPKYYEYYSDTDLSSCSSDSFDDEPPRKWWMHWCFCLCFKCW